MTTKQILIEARKLIERPEMWTQGRSARNAAGDGVAPDDPSATCFCTAGAITRVTYGDFDDYEAAAIFIRRVTSDGITRFNDSHTHAEVLHAFDRAIDAA